MKIALCDDNRFFLQQLQGKLIVILEKHAITCQIIAFASGTLLIESLKKEYYDIVFLDIDMPKINGKDVAQLIRSNIMSPTKIVFVSDYYREVFSTFKYDISSFIPKATLDSLLENEILRIIDVVENEKVATFSFRYHKDNSILSGEIYIKNILYFESANSQVIMYATGEKYFLCNYTLNRVMNEFAESKFWDVHRTCYVNSEHVTAVLNDGVRMSNGVVLPLSRNKRKMVKSEFLSHIKDLVIG